MNKITINNSDNNKDADDELINFAKESFLEILPNDGDKIDPLFLKNRTLTVTCPNSDIASNLRENMEEIVAKINEKIGEKQVDRIRYLL